MLCSRGRVSTLKGGMQRAARPCYEAGARPGGGRERERGTEQPRTSAHTHDVGAGSTQHHVASSDTTKKKKDTLCIESGTATVMGSRLPRVRVCTDAAALPCKQHLSAEPQEEEERLPEPLGINILNLR